MRWVGAAALLALAVLFGLLALGGALSLEETRRIWANGEVAEGTLVSHHRRKKSSAREYTYTFKAGDRVVTAERRSIPFGLESLPVGTKLVVRYDPKDPSKSVTPGELEELEHWLNQAFFPVLVVVLVLGAVYVARRKPPT